MLKDYCCQLCTKSCCWSCMQYIYIHIYGNSQHLNCETRTENGDLIFSQNTVCKRFLSTFRINCATPLTTRAVEWRYWSSERAARHGAIAGRVLALQHTLLCARVPRGQVVPKGPRCPAVKKCFMKTSQIAQYIPSFSNHYHLQSELAVLRTTIVSAGYRIEEPINPENGRE